ncbi:MULTISPECIES: hypothetical protein [unclassified Photobacterium]|uniref:hypothetical protein n=1 Tax=unclassified Photobacterium TaxID=2628852 RepID=UPI001EDCCF90|nr:MULTISPECIES: hypothetical protein [unclassified Photobacterium]MCG3863400.1 hypothetical protein [Photobacterium sp. Ph6]MCG3874929.1 hypothetical protein [Photobacterium sp. Ph5]
MGVKTLVASTLMVMSLSASAFASDLYHETTPVFKNTVNGNLLTGKDGLALYTFIKDYKQGSIPPKCTTKEDNKPLGSCLARWPAATVSMVQLKSLTSKDKAYGGVYNNELHKLQLTYDGLPVYYWFKDTAKNNFTGDGVGKAWALIEQGKTPINFSGLNKK